MCSPGRFTLTEMCTSILQHFHISHPLPHTPPFAAVALLRCAAVFASSISAERTGSEGAATPTQGAISQAKTQIKNGQTPKVQSQRVSSPLAPCGPQRDHTGSKEGVRRQPQSDGVSPGQSPNRGSHHRPPSRPSSLPKPCVAGSN